MLSIEAIDVRRVVIHKIDYVKGEVDLSDKYESLGENLADYFTLHLRNIINSTTVKTGKFNSPNCTIASCVGKVVNDAEDLLENSKLIAYWFLENFRKDKQLYTFLAFVEFVDVEVNKRYIGILKLDPQKNYIFNKEGMVESITTFPDTNKALNRALIARPFDDNKYDVIYRNQSTGKGEDPDLMKFWIEDFMECEDVPSPKFLTQLVFKETEKWIDKNNSDLDDEEPNELMETIKDKAQGDELDVLEVANNVLKEEEMKVRYINNLLDKGLSETKFTPDKIYAERIAKKSTYVCDYNVKLSGSKEALREIMSFEKNNGEFQVSLKTKKFTQK